MKTTLHTLLAALLLLALSGTVPALAAVPRAEASPDALVAELYASGSGAKSPFAAKAPRARLAHFFTKELTALIVRDGEQSRKNNEVGVLDFDPLYGAQDLEIQALSVGRAVTGRDGVSVPVSFRNFGKKKGATLDLTQEDGAWKIRDIHYADGSSLLKLFKAAGAKR